MLQRTRTMGMAGLFMPKADIWMKNWDMNHESQNGRNLTGRTPDYCFTRYRNLFWRLDEMATRQEKFIRDQGYFYLPTLDFEPYRGCAPLMSAYQLRLHHTRHHKAYIDKLNTLIVGTVYDGMPLDEIIFRANKDKSATAIYNNAAQHFNHCFFWKSLQPWGTIMPPDLKAALEAQWTTIEAFQDEFEKKSVGLFGSGWTFLSYNRTTQKFEINAYPNAGTPLTTQDLTPMLCLDVWEHAYYVDYENDRARWVKKFWEVTDWHWAERHWKRAQGHEYYEMAYF